MFTTDLIIVWALMSPLVYGKFEPKKNRSEGGVASPATHKKWINVQYFLVGEGITLKQLNITI